MEQATSDALSPLAVDGLLDALLALHYECVIPQLKRIKTVEDFLKKCKWAVLGGSIKDTATETSSCMPVVGFH